MPSCRCIFPLAPGLSRARRPVPAHRSAFSELGRRREQGLRYFLEEPRCAALAIHGTRAIAVCGARAFAVVIFGSGSAWRAIYLSQISGIRAAPASICRAFRQPGLHQRRRVLARSDSRSATSSAYLFAESGVWSSAWVAFPLAGRSRESRRRSGWLTLGAGGSPAQSVMDGGCGAFRYVAGAW